MGKTAATDAATETASAPASTGYARPAAGSAATEIGQLRFDLLRSALYHDAEWIRWQRIHRLFQFIVVLLGSGAIAAFGAAWPIVGQIAGALVATVSAAQLVWDFSGRARDHQDLKRRYYALLSEAEVPGVDLAGMRGRMTAIYADEPPLRDKSNRRAHNQAGESLFGDDFEQV